MSERRDFLRFLGASMFLGTTACSGRRAPPPRTPMDAGPPPMLPSAAGALAAADHAAMWRLLRAMAAVWSMPLPPQQAFDRVLAAKTGEPPSYLAEYRNARALLESRDALDAPGLRNFLAESDRTDPERHVRTYVIHEFAAMLVAYDGLAQFGLTRLFPQTYLGRARGYARAGT